jgi:CheY-like chemotaxis protein
MNLVGNAIKFTESGSVDVILTLADEEIATSARSSREELRDSMPEGAEGQQRAVRLAFTVRDTGPGISGDRIARIFDGFVQEGGSHHARHGGTGLGLTICRELVGLMGGEICVESEPARGSTFRFTVEFGLPERRPTVTRGRGDEPEESPRGGLRILLAEDNPVNQLVGAEILKRRGYEVVVAADGRAALELLARESFDLVLMDVQMPVMDGEEATRRIRAGLVEGCPADLPIIAVTAHAIHGDRERFLSAGMDDYVSKPLDPKVLEEVVWRVLEERRRSGS